jgi:dipeptidyl aminopeptidase/acylaminoacyl peptidase
VKVFLRVWTILLLTSVALVTLARYDDSGAWIAFSANRSGHPAIYLMSGDGASEWQVTPDDVCGLFPRWSHDGKWIAFNNNCTPYENTMRIRPGGFVHEPLLEAAQYFWAPDSNRLLMRDFQFRLHLLEDDGSARRLVDNYADAQWSPDGAWIYARPATRFRIHLDRINWQTGVVEAILRRDTVVTAPDLSPDGTRLVLGSPNQQGYDLLMLASDGSTQQIVPIDPPPLRLTDLHWSPDGKWIAFAGGLSFDTWNVLRVRPDGSGLEQLTHRTGRVWDLQWSPDGQWLLFGADYDGGSSFYRTRADGSSLERLGMGLSPQYAPVSGLRWRPVWLIVAAVGMGLASLRRSSPK